MTFREFCNGLKILNSIDMHELEAAGVIAPLDREAWAAFTRDPVQWLLRADDATADRLWGLMQSRMKTTHSAV